MSQPKRSFKLHMTLQDIPRSTFGNMFSLNMKATPSAKSHDGTQKLATPVQRRRLSFGTSPKLLEQWFKFALPSRQDAIDMVLMVEEIAFKAHQKQFSLIINRGLNRLAGLRSPGAPNNNICLNGAGTMSQRPKAMPLRKKRESSYFCIRGPIEKEPNKPERKILNQLIQSELNQQKKAP